MFIDPTCELSQRLDPDGFVYDDAIVAYVPGESSVIGLDYIVVFRILENELAEDFVFYDSIPPAAGRVVSDGGKKLTFTGTLAGPDLDDCILIPIVDPFDYVDTCLTATYSLYYVEGLTYVVTVNGGIPFEVVFGPGETVKTFSANPGDSVSVDPVANPGYILDPDQPAPFAHTFAVYGPDDCQLPELPNWPASASATDQVCSPLGLVSGSITVLFSVGPITNPTPVRYYLAYGTPEEQELTSAVTPVAPGSYFVTAVATDPADSLNDAGNTATFPLSVGAALDQECDLPTLAYGGASNALVGVGFVAVIITLAGMGFVVGRRRLEA